MDRYSVIPHVPALRILKGWNVNFIVAVRQVTFVVGSSHPGERGVVPILLKDAAVHGRESMVTELDNPVREKTEGL